MRASASSLRNLAFSASSSATVRAPGAGFSPPDRVATSQLAKVPLGMPSRLAASPWLSSC